jgi:hypothetical protein
MAADCGEMKRATDPRRYPHVPGEAVLSTSKSDTAFSILGVVLEVGEEVGWGLKHRKTDVF